MTPQLLAKLLQSLPPILHIIYPKSMLSCSEGSRGLSVPLRVIGIFTDTTISPSSWLRQCPDRYTIRAEQSPGPIHCGFFPKKVSVSSPEVTRLICLVP